jgi:hypothetical protein
MSGDLAFVISVLWPAILAALVVEWFKRLLRGSQGRARLIGDGGGDGPGCEERGQRVARDEHRAGAEDRLGVRRDPSSQWERASFEVRLSLVVRRAQRMNEGHSGLGGDR